MAICDKTQTKQNAQSLQKQPITITFPTKQIQSNYYLSVASVDSSTTESTCIFPKTLNKRINACVENTSKQKINSRFHITQNKFMNNQCISISNVKQETYTNQCISPYHE